MRNASRVLVVLAVVYTVAAIAYEQRVFAAPLMTVGSISVYAFDLLLACVISVLCVATVMEPQREPTRWRRVVLLACIAYAGYEVLVVGVAAWAAYDREPVFIVRELVIRLSVLLVPFLYYYGLRAVSPTAVIHVVEVSAVWLLGFAAMRYLSSGSLGALSPEGPRVYVMWGGSFLVFAWLLLSRVMLFRAYWWSWLLAVGACCGVFVANRRSGYVALLAVTLYQAILNRQQGRRVLLVFCVVGCALVGLYFTQGYLLSSTVYAAETTFNPNTENAADRLFRWRSALQTFEAEPFRDYIWTERLYLEDMPAGRGWGPHNFVLDIALREGVAGVAFWLFLLASTAVIGWRNRARDPVSGFALSFLLVYAVYAALNANWYASGNVVLLYLSVGIILYQDRVLDVVVLAPVEAPARAKRANPVTRPF